VPNFAYDPDKGKVWLGLLGALVEFARDLLPFVTAMQLVSNLKTLRVFKVKVNRSGNKVANIICFAGQTF